MKGRRAADRRREREQERQVDPNAKTRETTSVSAGHFDPRAETVLNAGEAPPAPAAMGHESGIAEDTARLGISSDVTAVRSAPDKPALLGGRVKVLRGPDAGFDRVVDVTPAIVGRKGDLKLQDPTVSREHLELRYDEEERVWVVSDLGSSSGTLLNGAPLEMATEVKHGDVIAIGQSELRFYWTERLPKAKEEPAPAPVKERTRTGFRLRKEVDERTATKTLPRRPGDEEHIAKERRPLVVAAAVAAFILIAGAGAASYFFFFHNQKDAAQVQLQVDTLLADATRLADEGKLDEARARLLAALALVPAHPTAESQLKMLESDVEAERALREARRLFDEGKVDEVEAQLRFIPDSSRFVEGREELKRSLGERARKQGLRRIEGLIDAKDLDGAAALLVTHLERWPKDAFATAMQERVAKIRNAPPPEDPTVKRARDAFSRGQAMEARVLVEPEAARGEGPARRYLEDLDVFETAVKQGRDRLAEKDKRALAPLERAYRLLPRLGRGAEGPSARPVRKLLADALFLDAIAARQQGDDCRWADDVRRARALEPSDAKIAAQFREVDQRAKAALTRAEARSGHDKAGARRIAEAGLCLAESGTPTHRALKSLVR